MGLVITRTIGTGWYGGNSLDTRNPEQTYTHKVWVHGINKRSQKMMVFIESKDSEDEVQIVKVGNVLVLDDCIVRLLEINNFFDGEKNCVHAKLKFNAPEEYIILRNNAKKRKGKVIELSPEHWEEQPCEPRIKKEYARQ